MSDSAKSYELTILNQKFTIKSDNDERHVKLVADYVNKKMHEIVSRNKATATSSVAILAALNIADDLFKLKQTHSTQVSGWVNKVKKAIAGLRQDSPLA